MMASKLDARNAEPKLAGYAVRAKTKEDESLIDFFVCRDFVLTETNSCIANVKLSTSNLHQLY